MMMKNPPHPGGVVLRQCIEPLGLTITGAATALGVTRNTLSELVNEKRGISPEMAVRLSKVFGGTEDGWLVQQAQYDLAQVRRDRIKLKTSGSRLRRSIKGKFRDEPGEWETRRRITRCRHMSVIDYSFGNPSRAKLS